MAPSRRMLAPLRSSNYVRPTAHSPTATAATETQRKPLLRYYTIIGIVIIFGFVQYSSNSKQIKDEDTDVQQGDLRIELNNETQSSEKHSGMTRVGDYIKTQDDEETQQNDRIEIRDTIQSREEDNHTTRDGGETQKLDKILSQSLHGEGKNYEDRIRPFDGNNRIPPREDSLTPLQPLQPSYLFVHINKTGGTSLIKMLRSRCEDTYNVVKKWDVQLHHRSFHATAHSYIEYYGRKVWNDAYSFAIVRHPLARQVSNFFFLANNCERNPSNCAEERIITGSINGVAVSKLTDEDKIKAFHEWMKNLYEKYPPNSREHYLFGSKGHGNEEYSTFSSTQTSWMVDDGGEIVVKAIFHLEDLSKDMHKLTEAIPCLASEGEGDTQLEHANATPHYPDFMLFAKDEWTRKIIKEVYAEDFKNFGYEL